MENNFDKYFKDNLDNRKFEMKPEFWEEAEALIVADEKRRGWLGFMKWFGLLLLVSVASFFIWKSEISNSIVNSVETKKDKFENSSIEKNQDFSSDVKFEKNNIDEVNTSIDLEKNYTVAIQQSNTVDNFKNKTTQTKSETQITNSTSKSNESKDSFSNSNNQNQNNSTTSFSNTYTKSNNTTPNNNTFPNQFIQNKITNPIIDKEENVETKTTIPSSTIPSTVETKDEKEEEISKPIAATITTIPSLDFLLENKNMEIPSINIDETCSYFHGKKKVRFGVTAGAVGYPLIENNSTQPFIGAKAGIFAEYNFFTLKRKGHWSIGSELLYHYRSGNFIATQSNENVQYSFGRRVTTNFLTPKNLHYLELPIYLKYKLPKVNFETGVSMNYLAGVRGILEQDNANQEVWISSLGFKKYHANVLLGFQYKLNDNIGFGVRMNYTLGGILDSNAVVPFPNDKVLRESGPLYLTFKVTQYLK